LQFFVWGDFRSSSLCFPLGKLLFLTVVSFGPYSCWLSKMCFAYADLGLLVVTYLLWSLYLVFTYQITVICWNFTLTPHDCGAQKIPPPPPPPHPSVTHTHKTTLVTLMKLWLVFRRSLVWMAAGRRICWGISWFSSLPTGNVGAVSDVRAQQLSSPSSAC
jgi:hypothetical protein